MNALSLARIGAILVKEFVQMRRDRMTFAMMVGIPIIQLILFGYAINTDPKDLPTAMVTADHDRFARSIAAALANSGYFDLVTTTPDEVEARRQLATGEVAFIVYLPPGFARDLVRGRRPQFLIEADATDPAAASNALGAVPEIIKTALRDDLKGALAASADPAGPIDVVLHRRYNPEGITQYNIVPGLLGVVLTMSTILMTALSLTRETERGTMENLLAMPVRPLEVMLGKIAPYIAIGFIQTAIILGAAKLLFNVPMLGSLDLLLAALLLFIAANVTLGYTFSTIAKSQMQAMQMTFFFFLPSLLLSGFMFPFRGMPDWAQAIGQVFPLTHFLRIVRGILLKGNDASEIGPSVWPIAAFLAAVAILALARYRRTLD